MSEAYDSDTDPNNPDAPVLLEPYYYRDNAAAVVRMAQERMKRDYSDDALNDLVWGVRKTTRPVRPTEGG